MTRKPMAEHNSLTCEICGHTWIPRVLFVRVCPKCKEQINQKAQPNKKTCIQCGYIWMSRGKEPRICNNCKSVFWNIKRKQIICVNCNHKWFQLSPKKTPKTCPKCIRNWQIKQMGNKGINNINWKGGVSEYPNHHKLKKERLIKLEQTGYVCETCGGKATEVHHLDKTKIHHEIKNLVALCHKCHMGVYHSQPKTSSKYLRLYGMTLGEIAKKVGCSPQLVAMHLRNRWCSKKYGDAINGTISIRRRDEVI